MLHYGEGAHPQLPQEQQRDLWRRLAHHRPPLPGPNPVPDRAVSRSSSDEAPAQPSAMSAFLTESLQRARTRDVHSQQVQEDHDRFVAETQDAVRRYLQVMAVCVVYLCDRGTTRFVSTNARYHVVASFYRCYIAPMTGAAPAARVDQEPAAAYGKPVCVPLPHPVEKVAISEPVLAPSTHFTQIPPWVITSLPCRIFPRPQCCFLPHDPHQRGTKSEVAASPLPSRGPKRGRKCYATPAFSGIPNAKCGEQNQKWSPTKRNKIRNGCHTLAFLRPIKRRKCYVTPASSGIPDAKRGGARSEGGNATSPLHSRGSPAPSAGSKIGTDPHQRGTKSEVAASPLPS